MSQTLATAGSDATNQTGPDGFKVWRPGLIKYRDALTFQAELVDQRRDWTHDLEAMARALYREWFVHFRFPGHEDHRHAVDSGDEGVIPCLRVGAPIDGEVLDSSGGGVFQKQS